MYSFGNCKYILLTFCEVQQTKERWGGGGRGREEGTHPRFIRQKATNKGY